MKSHCNRKGEDGVTRKARETKLTVDAFEGGIPLTTINGDGQPIRAGRIVYRDYERDRNVRTLHFHSEDGQIYNLGHTSPQHKVTNPYDFVKPLLDAGFEPRMHHPFNGGAGLFATFAHPGVEFPDVIGWDSDQHGGSENGMNLAVAARLDIRPGYNFRFIAGIFRQICTNGLITKWLGLGEYKLLGANQGQPSVEDWIEGRFREIEDFSMERKSTKALGWPVSALQDLFDENLENPLEMVGQQPAFVRTPLRTMARLPKYARTSLLSNLETLQGEKDMCQLDILNAITNTAIRRGEDGPRTRWQVYHNLEGTHGALSTLVEAGAFRAGVEGFNGR
jgi:hypothetical protein